MSKRFVIWRLFQKHSFIWRPTLPFKNFSSLHSMCTKFSVLKFWVQKNTFATAKSLKFHVRDLDPCNLSLNQGDRTGGPHPCWQFPPKMRWHPNCRARFLSASLDWLSTSVGGRMLAGRYHGCNCVMTVVNVAASAWHFAKRHVVFYTTVFFLPLSATHGANMDYMELGSCYLWGERIRYLKG